MTDAIPQAPPPPQQRPKSAFRHYAEAIVVAVILALGIRTFVVEAFTIPSGSMLSTLRIGDYLLVNKFIYYFTEPRRGDIIVFEFPLEPQRDFIKRIVGLPGETIEIKNKQVYINSQPAREEYVSFSSDTVQPGRLSNRDNFGPLTLPAGAYFMLGDNRDDSLDSRFWGPLGNDAVVGKAFLVYWSWDAQARGLAKVRWRRIGKLLR